MVTIAEIAQDPFYEILIIVFSGIIGTTQGYLLGKALVNRFPRLKNHAKMASILLFFLFLANAIISVPRFASPEKIVLSQIFETSSSEELASLIFTIFGVNTGFLAVLAISVTIITLMLLKITHLSGLSRGFVLFFSMLVLLITIFSRFTEYTPTTFEVFLYFIFQLGITFGIVTGSARTMRSTAN